MNNKYLIYNFISNVWLAITIIIKPDSFFTKLSSTNRYCRYKESHDAFYCKHRYAPDTEEAKYMINTKCIEVIAHLFKPFPPPCKTILLHLFPVVGGKTPVLSFYSKIIRRCSGLHTHTVQFRLYPGITTIP